MFFNPEPARRLHLVPIEGKSRVCSMLVMVLTCIIQAPITDATPLIVNPVVLGGVWHGCTASLTVVRVEGSTVSPPSVPRVTASIASLNDPQGSGASPDDPIQIGIEAHSYQGSGTELAYPLLHGMGMNVPQYLGPSVSDSSIIHHHSLLSGGTVNPYHFNTNQKRAYPPPSADGQQIKRRRLEANTNPSVSVPGLFDRPARMSRAEYMKLLSERIAEETSQGM